MQQRAPRQVAGRACEQLHGRVRARTPCMQEGHTCACGSCMLSRSC